VTLPPGKLLVTGSGQSCSASWHGEGRSDRGTVSIDMVGGPTDWWVSRALVQGSKMVRGQGIGSELLRLALEKAVEMGAIRVKVVPGGYGADPVKQQHFYERNGFRKVQEPEGCVWIWETAP